MTRKRIINRVAYWQNRLGLLNWDIFIKFEKVSFKKHEEWGDGVAKVDTNSEYKFATIRFDTLQTKAVDDAIIIHELLHCLISPLMGMILANFKSEDKKREWADYFHEQIVSELERIIIRINRRKND